MKKRILTMLALCATIMCLAACDNEETNATGTNGTATVTATPAAKEEADNSSTETENNTTVEPTTAPTTDTTVEATVTPTEAPTVTEVSWEESGMSYELFEIPDGTVAVIVTNNGDTIYHCESNKRSHNEYFSFILEPNGKYYYRFSKTEDAEIFTNSLENNSEFEPVSNKVLTVEMDCTVTNATNYNEHDNIEVKSDDIVKTFNNHTNLNVAFDKFLDAAFSTMLIQPNVYIVYNDNNEIVTILPATDNLCEYTEEVVFEIDFDLPTDLEVSKITVVTQYQWSDNSFE